MAQREIKPFKVTKEQIENYQFTKKQIKAYNALIKATERCKESGLTLLAKQFQLIAYPSKFYLNDMMIQMGEGNTTKNILCPSLNTCKINDSGADDTEYIDDKHIKD